MKRVDILKWVATVIQLIGYAVTELNIIPWNIVGIVLWFLVGVMWKDRALMVVHVGAFVSLIAGVWQNRLETLLFNYFTTSTVITPVTI